uniref:Uncharacterized protein n=1 Tax=Meloidogyne enterolobii TaxID=390850 RepID=A0A6V7XER7_MELEN|nr:unnamed protein product [Meloidogyne enterolobii]
MVISQIFYHKVTEGNYLFKEVFLRRKLLNNNKLGACAVIAIKMNFIKNKTTNLDDYSLNLICKEEKINKIISKHLIILQETIYNLTLNLLLSKKWKN